MSTIFGFESSDAAIHTLAHPFLHSAPEAASVDPHLKHQLVLSNHDNTLDYLSQCYPKHNHLEPMEILDTELNRGKYDRLNCKIKQKIGSNCTR